MIVVVNPRRTGVRAPDKFSVYFTHDHLAQYFGFPLVDAAREMGVGASTLKKVCRKLGLRRWPYRKARTVGEEIDRWLEFAHMAESMEQRLENARREHALLCEEILKLQQPERREPLQVHQGLATGV